MANNALTFMRCPVCGIGVGCITDALGVAHREDGGHEFVRPRPQHATVTMWGDLQAVLGHLNTVEFALGMRPEKPRRIDWEVVQMQLQDARAVIGAMALALTEADQ